MEENKFADLANKETQSDKKSTLSKALDLVIKTLKINNGSLKIYIHQGKWSPRIEIQNHLTKDID